MVAKANSTTVSAGRLGNPVKALANATEINCTPVRPV